MVTSPENQDIVDDIVIDCIEAARRENNVLWMKLLRIAIEAKPLAAKAILKEINAKDQEISKWLGRLAN